jgi:CheY-like chemotaxis protein
MNSLPPRLKVLAIGHDHATTQLLERACRSCLAGQLDLFAAVPSVTTALAPLRATAFDVAVLDPTSALGPAPEWPSIAALRDCRLIVVSARTDLALPAFERGVIDFVPKPFTPDRLAQALRRLSPALPSADSGGPQIALRRHGRIDFISVDDLLYVEGADKYSELVLVNGRRSFHDQSLARLEADLPRAFVRIHKSFLVRAALVSGLRAQKGSRYFAQLTNGLRLPVGRSRYKQIKSRLLGSALSSLAASAP